MKKKIKWSYQCTSLMLVAIILTTLLSACANPAEFRHYGTVKYTSYRDVPGVTADEIMAIDALRKQYGSFIFGSILSTKTFYTENSKIGGYSALLCEWLTELFEIP